MSIPILLRAGARYHLQHRWQLALALLGIGLGVAVVVAVDVATGSARRAFTLATEAVTGRATHELVGGPAGLPDSLYVRLRSSAAPGAVMAPVLDRYVRLSDHDGRVLRMLGVDPFAEAPFRSYIGPGAGQLDVSALLTARAVVLTRETAESLGLRAGDSLHVTAGSRAVTAVLGGTLDPATAVARRALADVMLADIATAQELTGALGILDRIELRVDDAVSAVSIVGPLPAGVRLLETEARAGATARLTRAFDINLTALALVALVFGMFLIYNSVTFSVVQRRPLLGLLRAQGVTAGELFRLIIAEAAVLGVVAAVLGALAGLVLGAELVRLVTRTINDLYFVVNVTAVRPELFTLVKGLLLGVAATLAAAVPPALEAVRTQPRAALARSVLERRSARSAPWLATAGVITASVALLLLLLPSRSLVLGFAALFILILAAALVTPGLTILLMRAMQPVAARVGPVARLAARGVTASLSRTAPAIAALAVAIAVGIAVTIMIGSFRGGVVRWLEQSLQADIYVSAPDIGASRTDTALDPALLPALHSLGAVRGVTTYRHSSLLLDDALIRVIALDLYEPHQTAFELLDAHSAAVWPAFARGSVLVSEPFAFRRGVGAGDTLVLPTDAGDRAFAIAAVFRDYASEHGVIFIDRNAWNARWDDAAVTALGVFLHDSADTDDVVRTIRSLREAAGVTIRPNRALRAATLQVFDRTFVITGVLRLLALIVAFVGVTGALMALQLERAREIGVLRATGLLPGQVWWLVTAQTALMGLAAVVLAAPLGLAMAWAMVHVINRRAFGWSFDMLLSAPPFVQALGVGLGAALLAGVYPAWRMARMRPAAALREDG